MEVQRYRRKINFSQAVWETTKQRLALQTISCRTFQQSTVFIRNKGRMKCKRVKSQGTQATRGTEHW